MKHKEVKILLRTKTGMFRGYKVEIEDNGTLIIGCVRCNKKLCTFVAGAFDLKLSK